MKFMRTWLNSKQFEAETLPDVLNKRSVTRVDLKWQRLEELIEKGRVKVPRSLGDELDEVADRYEEIWGTELWVDAGTDETHCFLEFDNPPKEEEIDRLKKVCKTWKKEAFESTKKIRDDLEIIEAKRSEGVIVIPYCPDLEKQFPEAYSFLVNVMKFRIDTFEVGPLNRTRSVKAIYTGSFENIQKCWEAYMKSYAEEMEPEVKKLKRIY
jgi:hypothetical protein